MVVHAKSAGYDGGNFAKISINNVAVPIDKNETGHYRGLHIVLINPKNGYV